MTVDTVKILCQGFQWPLGTKIEDINFFSDAVRTSCTDEIDLVDFLLGAPGKLKYSFEGTDKANGQNAMYFESGNMSFKLDDHVYINSRHTYLRYFFKIYEDTSYIKFKVKIVHNTLGLLFQGTVNQDGLQDSFSQDNNDGTINCLCVGFEKEMSSYYYQKELPNPEGGPGSIGWSGIPGGIYNNNQVSFTRWAGLVQTMILNNPFIPNFEFEPDVYSWMMAKTPRLFIDGPTGTFHCKQGYERIFQNSVNKWLWFLGTVNSMGWVYFIYKDTFYVKNRSNFTSPIVDYDWGLMINHKIAKKKPQDTYDYLVILDGTYDGGDNAWLTDGRFRGERPIVFSTQQTFYKDTIHFNRMTGNAGGRYFIFNDVGYSFSKFAIDESLLWSMYNIDHNSVPPIYNVRQVKVDKSNILTFYTGESGNQVWSCNLRSTFEAPWDLGGGVSPDLDTLLFKGNFGNQLFKVDNEVTPTKMTMNYSGGPNGIPGFIKTNTFARNFDKFLDFRNNLTMHIELDTLVTNPLQRPRFFNCPEPLLNGLVWGISNMEFDIFEETTTFDLFQIEDV